MEDEFWTTTESSSGQSGSLTDNSVEEEAASSRSLPENNDSNAQQYITEDGTPHQLNSVRSNVDSPQTADDSRKSSTSSELVQQTAAEPDQSDEEYAESDVSLDMPASRDVSRDSSPEASSPLDADPVNVADLATRLSTFRIKEKRVPARWKSSQSVKAHGPPRQERHYHTRDVPFTQLYPKSMSLIGVNCSPTEKHQRGQRAASCSHVRRRSPLSPLRTRLARRSSSLATFAADVRAKINRPRSAFDDQETRLLNRAVYEAWYFRKQQASNRGGGGGAGNLGSDQRETRRMHDKQPPRARVPVAEYNRAAHVKMHIDSHDGRVWQWLCDKMAAADRTRQLRRTADKQARASRHTRIQQIRAEAPAVYNAWKSEKDRLMRQRRLQQQEIARRQNERKQMMKAERKIEAEKVFEAFARDCDRRRNQLRISRQLEQQLRVATDSQAVAERDAMARAEFARWLQRHLPSSGRNASLTDSRRMAPPSPQPPWYPAGSQCSLHYRWLYDARLPKN